VKFVFILLLLSVAGFLVYDYQFAPRDQRMVFKKEIPTPPTAPSVLEKTPEVKPTRIPKQAPAIAAATTTLDETVPSSGFVPPKIATLEEATKNWHQIPERAFPRTVVLRAPVEMKMSVGSSQLAVGAQVVAIAAAQGELLVTPSAESSARGRVRVTDTDFPDQIQSTYETWKNHRIELARKSWEARQTAGIASTGGSAQKPESVDAPAGSLDDSGKPIRNSRGHYDVLLASIRSGQVTEVVPDEVKRWSDPRLTQVDGKPTWIIDLDYEYLSLFGPMPVTAHAHIQDGKVVRWLYPSGEPVD